MLAFKFNTYKCSTRNNSAFFSSKRGDVAVGGGKTLPLDFTSRILDEDKYACGSCMGLCSVKVMGAQGIMGRRGCFPFDSRNIKIIPLR